MFNTHTAEIDQMCYNWVIKEVEKLYKTTGVENTQIFQLMIFKLINLVHDEGKARLDELFRQDENNDVIGRIATLNVEITMQFGRWCCNANKKNFIGAMFDNFHIPKKDTKQLLLKYPYLWLLPILQKHFLNF